MGGPRIAIIGILTTIVGLSGCTADDRPKTSRSVATSSSSAPTTPGSLAKADPCALVPLDVINKAAGVTLAVHPMKKSSYGPGCYYAARPNADDTGIVTVQVEPAATSNWEARQGARRVSGIGEQAWIYFEGAAIYLDVLARGAVLRFSGREEDGITSEELQAIAARAVG